MSRVTKLMKLRRRSRRGWRDRPVPWCWPTLQLAWPPPGLPLPGSFDLLLIPEDPAVSNVSSVQRHAFALASGPDLEREMFAIAAAFPARPRLPARLRCGSAVWGGLRELPPAPSGLHLGLLGLPVIVDETLPARAWKAEDLEGKTLDEGVISSEEPL